MAITKLSCPDCGTVLRPAKPVEPGKKVKCPRCDLIFVAGADEDDDDRPRKADPKAKGAKKGAPAVKQKPKKQEEEVYGYIKDPELEKGSENQPYIEYAPDESIKDLRGPAIVILRKPATWLQFIGMLGAIGWMVAFVILLIPTAFPIDQDAVEKEKEKQKQMRGNQKKEADAQKAAVSNFKFFDAFDFNLGEHFLILMVPMILAFAYACVVTGGGISMANLESRRWAIASSIMVMLPIHIDGLALVFLLVFKWMGWMFLEDPDFGAMIGSVIGGVLYLVCLGVGAWCLKTLWIEEVMEGFVYDPE